MKLFFVRHSETIEWKNGIILWSLPWTLSEKWIREAHTIGEFLCSFPEISEIITSDLARAIKTGEIIAWHIQVPVRHDPIIRERLSWVAEWKTDEEIDWITYEKKSLPYRKHMGGESFREVRNRAKQFLESLPEREGVSILLVSHSVFILMLLSIFLGISIEKALAMSLRNTIVCIDTQSGKVEMITF